MKSYTAKVFLLGGGPPSALPRRTVTASNNDAARVALRQQLAQDRLKVVSVNATTCTGLVAYVEKIQ